MCEAAGKTDTADGGDVNEACNHEDALSYAHKQMRSKNGLPVSMLCCAIKPRQSDKDVFGNIGVIILIESQCTIGDSHPRFQS